MAFAALHYQDERDHDSAAVVTSRLWDAAADLGSTFLAAQADLAEAIARRLTASSPRGGAGLEFRNLETGEVVAPEMFTTTEDGSASVWAARTVSAAISGDTDGVAAFVGSLAVEGDLMMAKGLRMLLIGSASVLGEAYLRLDWAALEAQAAGAGPPEYIAECFKGSPTGVTGDRCVLWMVGDRRLRDREAARHVIETGHTINLREE
jgi:hypothetical protein